jgi:transposase
VDEGVLSMSERERERAFLIRQVAGKILGQKQAAERLGIGTRQVKRLVRAWRKSGDRGLLSQQRGMASNHRLEPAVRIRIESALRERYADFGPTLAAENLAETENIRVSKETVRSIQVQIGLWNPKARRLKRVFKLRDRRPRCGELIQIDGSQHDWFEGRADRCTLIVFIDDATSRLMALHFTPTETTLSYIETLKRHVMAHGVPLAFYSDRHSIFRVNAKDAASGDGKTELNRVTERLKIEQICARTPQAKGRVERANQTLQDRLIKDMRLKGISSMAQAEAFLPDFIRKWNARFAVDPRDSADAHRPWRGTAYTLDAALARREERLLSKSLTFRSDGTVYCIKTRGPGAGALRGACVTLYHFANGEMEVHYKDRKLAWKPYKTMPRPSPVEDEKTINTRMDGVVAKASLPATPVPLAWPNVARHRAAPARSTSSHP